MKPIQPNRRTVLKTIGAGVVGSAALTGTASASACPTGAVNVAGGTISLENLDFNPDKACVPLDGSTTVTWEHNDSGGGFIHNVSIDDDSMKGPVKSPPLTNGDTYTVTFTESGDDLVIEDNNQSKTADLSTNSVDLHVHCDLHRAGPMEMELFHVFVGEEGGPISF